MESKIPKKLPIVVEKFICHLEIEITSRMTYDGAMYYDVDARELMEKKEKESKEYWERTNKRNKGKEEIEALIKVAAKTLAKQ